MSNRLTTLLTVTLVALRAVPAAFLSAWGQMGEAEGLDRDAEGRDLLR